MIEKSNSKTDTSFCHPGMTHSQLTLTSFYDIIFRQACSMHNQGEFVFLRSVAPDPIFRSIGSDGSMEPDFM